MKNSSLAEVRVPVQVVLGERDLTVEQITQIGEGKIIELSSLAGEPVELRAEGEAIARGEVVIIDEHFGIRITSVVKTPE